ncbi:MAG: hypothetical protein ACYTAN_18295 [Planctomycetota bacterium]|jgi:hypothetical protein
MRKHVIREECDSVDEVCGLFNELFGIQRDQDERLKALEAAKAPKAKKKGGTQ